MKKFLTMILLAAMCLGLMMGSAQAGYWLEEYIGYYELQNVAIGSFTLGPSDVGFDMSAVVHEDGVIIITMDQDLIAEYIDGYASRRFIGDAEARLDLFLDDQGRLHIRDGKDYDAIDYRLRRAEIADVEAPMATYVGDWRVTADDAKKYGDVTMTIFKDGYGIIYSGTGPIPVCLGMKDGEVCLVSETGVFMPLTQEANGAISFTLEQADGTQETLHVKRAF